MCFHLERGAIALSFAPYKKNSFFNVKENKCLLKKVLVLVKEKLFVYSFTLQIAIWKTISKSKKSCGNFIEFSIVHKIGYNNAI